MEAKEVINQLLSLYHEHKLAHAYLIETNNVLLCYNDIINFIKIISCKEKYIEKCSSCNLCHLIDLNNLPSLITIEPEGKNIKKDAIEKLKDAFSVMPTYTENNIYIIKYPEKMNATAYNKLLKFLEEPESNILGFFITENTDTVANTIVSRCEVLKIQYNSDRVTKHVEKEYQNFELLTTLANDFVNKIQLGETNIIWYNNTVLLKELPNRVDIINFIKIILNIYQQGLNNQSNKTNSDYSSTLKKINICVKYLSELNYNVNIALLLDSFSIEMRQINE